MARSSLPGLNIARPILPQTRWRCPEKNKIRRAAVVLIGAWANFCPLFASSSATPKWLQIVSHQDGGTIHFYVENLIDVALTATMSMEVENLDSTVPWPYTASFAARSRTHAFDLHLHDPQKGWRWKYRYDCTWGDIHASHDDRYRYWLPFAPGTSFPVSQGYFGTFSHTGFERYAIDWKMPIGTPICAAREGVVVAAKDDSDHGGPDKKYDWDANYILIQHSDGTYGHYAHLMQAGNVVKMGEVVKAGQWIAFSGNTGFTTGPHLHFDVFTGKNGSERQTIPVRFKTTESSATYLAQGSSCHFGRGPPKGGTPNTLKSRRTPFGVPALAGSRQGCCQNENCSARGRIYRAPLATFIEQGFVERH